MSTSRQNGDLRTGDLLPVLRRASHDDLKHIVEALDRSWDVHIKSDVRYRRAAHDLTIIPEVIADHVTRAGGNAVRNKLRGGGPPYEEVLRDVCKVMKVEIEKDMTVLAIEEKMLKDIIERLWEAMSPEQRKEVLQAAAKQKDGAAQAFADAPVDKLWLLPFSTLMAQVGLAMAALIMKQMGVQLAGMAAGQALRMGLNVAASAALARGVAVFTGPVGWAATAAWTAVEVLGPSYRGLAPAVFHIAWLRRQFLWREDEETQAA